MLALAGLYVGLGAFGRALDRLIGIGLLTSEPVVADVLPVCTEARDAPGGGWLV